jgi:hypothetical protein
MLSPFPWLGYSIASAFNQVVQFAGKTVGQFQVLNALTVAAAAITNDHVDVMGGDITAPHIAVVIVFAVEWTDI